MTITEMLTFCEQIKKFENLETDEERIKAGKDVYDQFIMKELLSQSHVRNLSLSTFESISHKSESM